MTSYRLPPWPFLQSKSWHGAAVAGVLFVWFAATAWIRPLAMPDEGRYVSVAWELLNAGGWTVPTLDGLPFFHKPPLFYWIAAAAMRVAGVSAWAARVPSLLAATAIASCLFWFTRRTAGERQAQICLVVLATTPFFYLGAQYANMDMLVAASIGCAVLLAADYALRAEHVQVSGAGLWAAYVMAAVAVLSKGLIGCVLPAAILVIWLLACRRPNMIARLVSPVGAVLFAITALPWFIGMQSKYPGFFDYFVMEQHVRRFAAGGFNNVQPWWFYAPVLLALGLPWTLNAVGVWRRGRLHSAPGLSVRALMYCWTAVVVLFFSFPQSKLIGYVLPAIAPIAWLVADAIAGSPEANFVTRNFHFLTMGTAVILIAAVSAYALRTPHSAQSIGLALAARRDAGEPVVFVDSYPYDVVFYARLRGTVPVVKRWSSSEISAHDDWAKELYDAARFDANLSPRVLIEQDQMAAQLGKAPASWLVGGTLPPLPHGTDAQLVAAAAGLKLWRVSRQGAALSLRQEEARPPHY